MHTEKRADWLIEAKITLACGFLYGITNTIAGHPFDTIKTKMQAQEGHMATANNKGPGFISSLKNVWTKEGPLGFYRGCIPPMIGSVIFRSVQFSSYEAFFTATDGNESVR